MYFGGKDGTKLYFGKPVLYENENAVIKTPPTPGVVRGICFPTRQA
jgi:hypothetical protein